MTIAKASGLALLLTLAGCGEPRECLQWETHTTLFPMWIGKTMVLMPQTQLICIKWKEPDAQAPGDRK